MIPPVGMNRIMRNGAASAFSVAIPPSCRAGKNFTVSIPSSSAAISSEAVATPGNTGTDAAWQRRTTWALNPGVTT